MKSTVHIVLPVFNRKKTTLSFVGQLKKQTYENYRIILVDDGSTDGTAEAVSAVEDKLVVLTTQGNKWWGGSLHIGMNWLVNQNLPTSDYILIANDDSLIPNNFLESAVDRLSNTVDTMLGSITKDQSNGEVVDRGLWWDWEIWQFYLVAAGEEVNCLSTRGLFFKASDLNRVPKFHPKAIPHYFSDYAFTIEAYHKGFKLVTDDAVHLCIDVEPAGLQYHDTSSWKSFFKDYFSLKSYSHPVAKFFFIYYAAPNLWSRRLGWILWARAIVADCKPLLKRSRFFKLYSFLRKRLKILSFLSPKASLTRVKKVKDYIKTKWTWKFGTLEQKKEIMGNAKIFQIYYLPSQLRRLDPCFIPYNNIQNLKPEWCEYHIFKKAYEDRAIKPGDLTGFVSWKFKKKTGKSGYQFRKFIHKNPGFDVYFINPFFEEASYFRNIWLQGNDKHPNLLPFAQMLFDRVGVNVTLKDMVMSSKVTAFCNFWVGSKEFWDRYMEFTLPFYDLIENHLSEKERKFILSPADSNINSPYIPFIMERMFSTFLALNSDIKFKAWVPSKKELKMKYGSFASDFDKCNAMKNEISIGAMSSFESFENHARPVRQKYYSQNPALKNLSKTLRLFSF